METNIPGVKKDSGKYCLAVDISNETVKTLIFKRKDEKIVIDGVSIQFFERFGVFDTINFGREVITKNIIKAIAEAYQNLGGEISKPEKLPLLLGLPANISKGRIFFGTLKRNNPKIEIQEKEEKEIYKRILKESQKEISENFAQSYGILPEDLEFLTLEILDIKIDGYEVPYLRGFKGKELSFRVMAIFSPKYYIEEFKKIFKNIGFEIFKIIHLAQNLKLAFKEDISDCIFLDINDNFTQIFLIKEGKLISISEFEIGGGNFTRTISQVLGITEKAAQNLKEKYFKKALSEEVRKRVKEIIKTTLDEWFFNLKFKLKEAIELSLPSNFFLFGSGSQLPEIQEILETGEWEEFVFIQEPKVKLIYPKELKNIEDTTNILNTPQFISTILISYAPLEI